MEVEVETARLFTEHEGRMYYFCAPGCKRAFEEDPGHYLDPAYQPKM
jgi:YHS domain-containing protein